MGRKKKSSTFNEDRFLQENGNVLQVADSMRKRQWFLTINENAECFKDFDNYVVSFGERSVKNGNSSGYYHFAYILHDRDSISEKGYMEILDKATSADCDISLFERAMGYIELPAVADNENDLPVRSSSCYAYKPKHYHLLMCFENARSWSAVKNHFKGAHVQSCLSVVNSFRYLTHNTKEAIAQGKTKYDIEDVVFSDRGLEFFSAMQGEEVQLDYFDAHKIAKYVWIDEMESYHDFLLRFGAPQVQRWMSSINSECEIRKQYMYATTGVNGGQLCMTNKFYWNSDRGLQFVSDVEIKSELEVNVSSVKLFDIRRWVNNLHLTSYGESYYKIVLYYRLPMNDIETYLICRTLPKEARRFGLVSPELIVEQCIDVPFACNESEFQLVVNQ